MLRLYVFSWLIIILSSNLLAVDVVQLAFKKEPQVTGNGVYLRDLVDISTSEPGLSDSLAAIPLAPAPSLGSSQTWTQNDINAHLRLRGWSDDKLKWNGAASANLLRVEVAPQQPQASNVVNVSYNEATAIANLQPRTIAQAERNVANGIRQFLLAQSGDDKLWNIQPNVPPQYIQRLYSPGNIKSIRGGQAPFSGPQVFEMVVKGNPQGIQPIRTGATEAPSADETIQIQANITLPPQILTATKALRKGQIIGSEDITFQPLYDFSDPTKIMDASQYHIDADELLGKQVRQAVSSGLPIPRTSIGAPHVIERNDLVEIEVLSGAVRIRTVGKALESGAIGDLIPVEYQTSKKRLMAEISGSRTVRVMAQPADPQAVRR